MDKKDLGSKTAKAGFQNEKDVVDTFNHWKTNKTAQNWLKIMNYRINDIEYVKAEKISGSYKADVQVQIKVTIKLKTLVDYQNIQVKLVSNEAGYNQINKRWLIKYKEMWNIPADVYKILQYYTGEKPPYKSDTKDSRRMFMTEMKQTEQKILLDWLQKNKTLIVSDILKGRGKFAAEWVLVIKKVKSLDWVLKPINVVMNYFASSDIEISKSGNIHIGKITMQRKGGDAGRDTAKMLQFKINPTLLFDI